MLIAENITKKFSGVTALDGVCLELHPGKVNAIIGENGAGKSTLMKILSGVDSEYEGTVTFNNKLVKFRNTREAQQAGIAIIHQELNLIPDLTITENLFLGREMVNAFGFLEHKKMRREALRILQQLRLTVDPDTKVSTLKVGQQQVIEIAKALLLDAQVIIMDEPTSAISQSEVEVLFEIIAHLKQENKAIAYISHKLDELFRIADRYIVLRDGRTIESGEMAGLTSDHIIQKMVGREIKLVTRNNNDLSKELLLSVEGLAFRIQGGKQLSETLALKLHRGEVLGVFGLMGAGRTRLIETLFGLRSSAQRVSITVNGNKKIIKSPIHAIESGLALVPEDRKRHGLILDADVQTNICITTLNDLRGLVLLDGGKELSLTKQYIGDLKIKTSSPKQIVKTLSGGNQQKIVLAKWLATKPKVLLLDEPTRGIDIGAKAEIYKLIMELADQGMGIIVVSSELPEILAISDRIMVMAEGKVTAEFPAADATESKILKQAIPHTV